MQLKGVFTAMITPFTQGVLDEKGLIHNIHRQLDAGITGLVILGSTGESATLTDLEERRVIELTLQEAKGKALVIVGTGSNATHHAIEKTCRAEKMGADGAIIVTPYYNKPSQEGILRHFEAIASKTNLPLIVYNVPGRTGVNIETSTLMRIASLPQIVGVKEASGNFNQILDVIQSTRSMYPKFSILSGDDAFTLPMVLLGASGVISVVSNLVPRRMVEFVEHALTGDFHTARRIHEELFSLFKLAFIEVNPVPIKACMDICGLPAGECRLPLYMLKEENREKLVQLLGTMGLGCTSCV